MSNIWLSSLEHAIGARAVDHRVVAGGDFAQAFKVRFDDGRSLFVKTHAAPPKRFFSTEATGLSWLRDAHAVAIPEVIFVSDDPPCLALEWIDVGGAAVQRHGDDPGADSETSFGRALAALHASGADAFGRADACTTGSLAVPNDPTPDWPTFYAERRLMPLARIAHDRGSLSAGVIARLESLSLHLDRYGAAEEGPARSHGDLWAGNRVVDIHGKSWLVDPAAHGAHREFDLAMMRLFGGFSERCQEAYREMSPLADDWQGRVPLHQLAPLVVHAIKFGGGYVDGVAAALDALSA